MEEIKKFTENILIDALNIPSHSGNEKEIALYFADLFKKNDFNVEIIEHSENRNSIIACYGNPKIAFSTHLDSAIEWKKPSVNGNIINGIGACDAKASLACQASIAIELSKKGKDIAVIFVAGEETDSIGAKYLEKNPIDDLVYIIHGEPTNGDFITRTASVLEIEIKVPGEKGHSSCKNNDISSIHRLLNALNEIQTMCKENDLIFHIGNIVGGGDSPSSFPEYSSAMIQMRGYLKSEEILQEIEVRVNNNVEINIIYQNNTCNLITVDGYNKKEVLFGSDAAILQDVYKQLLVGPGDIERGHKPDEYITKDELYAGLKCLEDAYSFLEKKLSNKSYIKVVENKDEFEIAYNIRVKVFVEEQNVPIEMELDEFDEEALHILLYDAEKPVACARLIIQGERAIIGRVAVLKEYRKKGYGKMLCSKLLEIAKEKNVKYVMLHAQCYAIGFYNKLGFVEYEERFDEAGIEHIEMRKEL